MIKRFALALMTVLLLPVLACAGIVSSAVLTGSGSGTITPSGSKNYTALTNPTYVITAVSGFTLDKVTLRTGSGPVNTVTPSGTGPWSYVAPLSGSVQTLSVYFKQDVPAVRLNANLGLTPKTAVANTQLTISGGASTIYPVGTSVGYTYAVSTGGVLTTTSGTASNTSAMTTKFSAVEPGLYTVTLTMTKGAITSSNTATINVTGEGLAASNLCLSCHTGWPQAVAYAGSIHSHNAYASCEACHNPDGNQAHSFQTHDSTVDPSTFTVISSAAIGRVNGMRNGTVFCTQCHNGAFAIPHAVPVPNKNCNVCHTPSGTADAHSIVPFATMTVAGCVDCHSVAQSVPGLVADNNNGVRSITQEFGKWSHHVTGVDLDNAHCAACHLEGKISNGNVVIDFTKHMTDATTHLRNCVDDSDYVWNPATPNHSNMDNFCMSCHSGTGATSPMSVQIQAYINVKGLNAAGKTASATNPFGDTISNRYDKMQRPGVINVNNQFDTANNSHHAVKGPRYTGRTRVAGQPRAINNPATFAANSSSTLFGTRQTMFDAGNLNQLYTPLANATAETAPRTGAATLGDDSTLHCGDCHTVGQWKPGTAQYFNTNGTVDATKTSPAIGAHGSNNEYLLRNFKGTDVRHTQNAFTTTGGVVTYTNPDGAFLVCYNCHNYSKYGSIYGATGVGGGHIGEYDAGGRCNGIGNTIPFNGYTTGLATDGTQFKSRLGAYNTHTVYAGVNPGFLPDGTPAPPSPLGEQAADFGNVFGIQCANCHNSGAGNAYGGIHGSANNQTIAGFTNAAVAPSTAGNITVVNGTYIDGAQNTTKIIRFLPGLGDASHVPGNIGGVTGGSTAVFNKYSAYNFAYYSSNRKTGTALVFIGKLPANYGTLPVRPLVAAAQGWTGKAGSYNFTTGGVTNDTNWEQKHWQQTIYTKSTGTGTAQVYTNTAASGAGCYTLGNAAEKSVGWPEAQQGKLDASGNVIAVRPATNEDLRGPSQGVAGEPNPLLFDNWGGCDDHGAPVGGGNHGFIKRIVRPVTY